MADTKAKARTLKDGTITKDERELLTVYRGIPSKRERAAFILLMKAIAWGRLTS